MNSDDLSEWKILTAESDEGILIVRLRIRRPPLMDIDDYQKSVIIKWPYESETGMPSDSIKERMNQFESSLDELTADNDNSYLMLVATGLGLREWQFYAKSEDIFMEQLNRKLAGHGRFPIKIDFYDDPSWQNWRDFVELYSRNESA